MTRKQVSFINHYLKCKNGAEACRLAGYSSKGADRMAHILLRNVEISEKVDQGFRELAEGLEITKDNILKLLWKIARTGEKERDRITATSEVAVISGFKKENTVQINIYPKDQQSAVRDIMRKVLRGKPQDIVVKED